MADDPPRDPLAPEIHETDLGNARRFTHDWRFRVRYVWPRKEWLVWDGKRWANDTTGEVVHFAKATIGGIYREAFYAADDQKRRKVLGQHAVRSESHRAITAMLALAASEREVAIAETVLDADPWLLNCANGVVDLRTGELADHGPALLMTKITNAAYEPAASCPRWTAFLERVVPDVALRGFLRRAAGYSATGLIREENCFFVHGPTACGKSTFIAALRAALGSYAMSSDFAIFTGGQNHGGPREGLARLAGARLVSAVETDEGSQFDQGMIKWVTGGDQVAARHLYRDTFEYVPQFKLWLVANIRPTVRGDDTAFFRRLLEVPFRAQVSAEERDDRLKEFFRSDPTALAAILAWVIAGAKEWSEGRLQPVGSVAAATEDYREEMDIAGAFLSEVCSLGPQAGTVSVRDLRTRYIAWCEDNGHRPLSGAKFNRRLAELGCSRMQSREGSGGPRIKSWRGISIRAEGDEIPF